MRQIIKSIKEYRFLVDTLMYLRKNDPYRFQSSRLGGIHLWVFHAYKHCIVPIISSGLFIRCCLLIASRISST